MTKTNSKQSCCDNLSVIQLLKMDFIDLTTVSTDLEFMLLTINYCIKQGLKKQHNANFLSMHCQTCTWSLNFSRSNAPIWDTLYKMLVTKFFSEERKYDTLFGSIWFKTHRAFQNSVTPIKFERVLFYTWL